MDENVHIPYKYGDDVVRFESEATYLTVARAVNKYVVPGGTVLDVGCGRGEMMDILSRDGYRVSGVDMDDECLRLSSRYGETINMNFDDIALDRFDDRFDCLLLSHVLEHMENPRETLLRLATISKGVLVISVPNPYYLIFILRALFRKKPVHMNLGHLQIWDWSHFKTFAEVGCGMEVLEFYSDTVPVPLPHFARKLLHRANLLQPLEGRILKTAFPYFCRSITAVVRPKSDR